MDKPKILSLLLAELKANLESLVSSALTAKEAATSEESKAENKYDTRGLEASYLAGAQAKRADELKATILKLQKITLKNFKKEDAIDLTAVVKVIIDEETEKYFFILPSAGGLKVVLDKITFNVITPESPVGSLFLDKKKDDSFQVNLSQKQFSYEIAEIY